MANIKVRYLVAKKQKSHTIYYWQPKKELQQHGFLPMRLAEQTNLLEDAIKQAVKYNNELDSWRKTGDAPKAAKEGTMTWLIEEYLGSDWFKNLAPRTQKDYEYELEDIKKFCGQYKISSVTRRVCKAYYQTMCAKSVHNGNAAIRVLRVLFSYAVDGGALEINPVKGMRLIGTEARQQVWTHEECERYIQKAMAESRRSIALAFIIAENTGQREGDILKMKRSQYDGKSIEVTQEKTGSKIKVKCTAILKKWIDETPGNSEYLVVSETTGAFYKGNNFRNLFLSVKAGLALEDRLFMDLRRTAVVRLAEADCTIPEIAAITGHSIQTSQKILEVYLPRNAAMASNAIDKLEKYRQEKLEERLEVVK